MAFLDWVKDKLGIENKPAPAKPAPVQGPKPLQSWSSPGTPTAVEKAEGAKPLGQNWKPAPTGTTRGVPNAVIQSLPKETAEQITKPSYPSGNGPMSQPWLQPYEPPMPEDWFAKDVQGSAHSYQRNEAEMQKLGPGVEKLVEKTPLGRELTWEAYDALSPEQRAAVDFNGLLFQAREADLAKDKEELTGADLDAYNADVLQMFGKAGGSQVQAKETMRLLKAINFQAVGQDLDEFLSMEAGFSPLEVKNFTFSDAEIKALENFEVKPPRSQQQVAPTSTSGYPGTRGGAVATGSSSYPAASSPLAVKPTPTALSEADFDKYLEARSIENSRAISTALASGVREAYAGMLRSGADNTWTLNAALGTQQEFKPEERPPGYGRGPAGSYQYQMDEAIEQTYLLLQANPNAAGMEAVMVGLRDQEWTDDEKKMLWQYIDDRSRKEIDYLQSPDAKKIRELLGWK